MRPHIYRRVLWTIPLLVLMLTGCTTSSSTSVGPVPTNTGASQPATPQGTPRGVRPSPVAGLLDPAPANCAAVAPPDAFTTTTFGGGFVGETRFQGSAPAWELGMGIGPLHLNDASGATLWFQVYPSNSVVTNDPDADSIYTTQAMLDPSAPNRGSTANSTGHWNIWGIGLMVLKAGCYELDVSSQQGSWHMVFAAGR
jgi:hypothetical protein